MGIKVCKYCGKEFEGTAKVTNNLVLSRGFDPLFNTNYGKGTSNEQLMLEHR